MKINSLLIVTMIVASSMILPVGVSYAQTYGGAMQPPSSSGNQTSMNQTMAMPSNSTSANSTVAMHDNASMTMTTGTNSTMAMNTNSTSMNQTMGMPTNSAPTNMTASSTSAAPTGPMSPLQQFKSGVSAKSVTCQSGYSLVIKAEDGSPACVHSSTVQILILRGWATAQ